MDEDSTSEFRSSVLGTQDHWDEVYQREIDVFTETGDVGEIWFGEDTQERMVQWVTERSNLPLTSRIIDLGCGNGTLLSSLRQEGFVHLTGVDYSKFSIDLAKRIAEKENATDISFQTCDILLESEAKCREKQFDLCVDKGTYDAISLKNPEDPSNRLSYIRNVHCMLSVDGMLLITSCNWTRSELEKDFINEFEIIDEIPAPTFTFGGKTGQTVTTVIMKRKDKSGPG